LTCVAAATYAVAVGSNTLQWLSKVQNTFCKRNCGCNLIVIWL
jgi:hypothetical protein